MKAGMRAKDTSASATKLNDRKGLLKVKYVKMLRQLFNTLDTRANGVSLHDLDTCVN